MIEVNLADLMRAAGQRTQAPERGLPEAQALELAERLKKFATRHTFQMGQIVQHKEGLEYLKDTRDSVVVMFFRYFDMSDPLDLAQATKEVRGNAINYCDCLLMHIVNKDCVCIHPCDSLTLEPRHIDLSAFENPDTSLTE